MFTRVLQVADKIEGMGLLGDVLSKRSNESDGSAEYNSSSNTSKRSRRGMSCLDAESVSETVVLTLLTTPDDAKGALT
jgi:hypothetical protein